MAQRSEHADRVLDLARKEADRFCHRYLGPEHLVLGVLRAGGSVASRVLEARGVDLPTAREALGRLVDRGVVPGPRRSDAELLGSLGIDLDAIRRTTEQSFALAQVHEQPVAAAAVRLGRPAQGLPGRAAGLLLAMLGIDLDQVVRAVTAELIGVQR